MYQQLVEHKPFTLAPMLHDYTHHKKYFAWFRMVIIVTHSSKDCPLYSGFLHPKLGYSTCPCLHCHLLSVHGLVILRLHPSFHLADSLPSRFLWFSVAM